jgi:hypothetical protein
LLLIVWLGGYLWYDIYRERHENRWKGIRAKVRESGANPDGYSHIAEFMQFDKNRLPREVSLLIYSADAVLPVVDLHAYGQYYPGGSRWGPGFQHVCGWVLISVFLAWITVL